MAEKREAEQRAAEEAARAAAQAAAAPAQPAPADTTLHKPKTAEAAEKKAKKPAKQVTVWKDESAKKRAIKTRGDATGGDRLAHAQGRPPHGMPRRRPQAFAAARPNRWCARSTCRRRSPSPTSPTRCR